MWLLKEKPAEGAPQSLEKDAIDTHAERAITCKACGHAITTHSARTSVHGAHEHRRVNPSGVDFHVGCFSIAPGCDVEGTPTTFWTWFPGYAWQLATCGNCGDHLGWAFTGEGTFFGLILPRLSE
jgi:ribosomal protein S27E